MLYFLIAILVIFFGAVQAFAGYLYAVHTRPMYTPQEDPDALTADRLARIRREERAAADFRWEARLAEERDAFEAAADRDLRARLLRARQEGYAEAEAQWQQRTNLVRADRGYQPPPPPAQPTSRRMELAIPRRQSYSYQTNLTAARQRGTSGFIDRIVQEHIAEPQTRREITSSRRPQRIGSEPLRTGPARRT